MKSKSRHLKNWVAEYVGSYVDPAAVPQDRKPVIAVIGRSNVGKSSFINSLTGQKGLARISANPGKTQTLNYYLVNESFFLVDMPGYGYAKVSKEQRVTWSAFSGMFLQKCENLLCLLILTDANIIPQDIDIRFINWCGEQGIPITIIRTKIDKSKSFELVNMEKLFFDALSVQWEANPVLFRHSASKNLGTAEIRIAIESMLK